MANTRLTATSFVALCKSEQVKLPPNTAAHQAFLKSACHADPSVLRAAGVWKERSASLCWAHHSLALNDDPSQWETTLNPVLLPSLLSLYAAPPYHGPAPAPSNTARLAAQITLFDPAAPPEEYTMLFPPNLERANIPYDRNPLDDNFIAARNSGGTTVVSITSTPILDLVALGITPNPFLPGFQLPASDQHALRITPDLCSVNDGARADPNPRHHAGTNSSLAPNQPSAPPAGTFPFPSPQHPQPPWSARASAPNQPTSHSQLRGRSDNPLLNPEPAMAPPGSHFPTLPAFSSANPSTVLPSPFAARPRPMTMPAPPKKRSKPTRATLSLISLGLHDLAQLGVFCTAPGLPTHVSGFLGIPGATVIVGQDIGFDPAPGPPICTCSIATFFPGTVHRGFECPLRYIARYGRCPGWTLPGVRIPAAWNGNCLTPATRAEWLTYITQFDLTAARASGRNRVAF